MAKRKDYYKLLGVEKSCSPTEIKRAFKKLAIKYHPDKAESQTEEAQKLYVDITEAYEILSDNDKRERYDRGEDVLDNQGGGGHHHHNGGFGGFPGGYGFPGGGHHQQQGGGGFHYTFNFGR
eukprot:gene19013-22759_t